MNNQTNSDNFLALLLKFCSEYAGVNDWMTEPFKSGDKNISTNGHILLATPLFDDTMQDLSKKVKSVYPMQENVSHVIEVSLLQKLLEEFPKVDCFDEVQTKCDACYNGLVDFEFEHGGKTYELEGECPVCEGEGMVLKKDNKPNGKKELDYSKLIKIGVCPFLPARIEELVSIATSLNESSVKLANQTELNRACLFKVGEVDVLIMPSLCNHPDDIVKSINIS